MQLMHGEGSIKRHLDQPEHSRCLEMSENFMSIAEGQKDDVMSMLRSAFHDKITRNMSIGPVVNKSYEIAFLFGVTA
jgi:hypothetical protein